MKRSIRVVRAAAGLCAVLVGGVLAAFGAGEAYMVVDLATGGVTYEDGTPSAYTNDVYKTTKMVFRKVPAGTYSVQDGAAQATMAQDYYIGVYEVTAGQYALMQNPNATVAATEANMTPRVNVSYNTFRGTQYGNYAPRATSPLGALTKRVRSATGDVSFSFDLPTEAMWEVAARAMPAGDGSHAAWPWFFGAADTALGDYAWCAANAGDALHVAGGRLPNAWGLYDMYGNAWEWCRDHYAAAAPMVFNQTGNTYSAGNDRVIRGGGYGYDSSYCRSGIRYLENYRNNIDDLGFRIATIAPTGEIGPDLGENAAGSYMVVDLRTGDVTYEEGRVSDYTNRVYKTTKMAFRRVPAGQ